MELRCSLAHHFHAQATLCPQDRLNRSKLFAGNKHQLAIQPFGHQLQSVQSWVALGLQELVLLARHTHTRPHILLSEAECFSACFELLTHGTHEASYQLLLP